MINKKFFPKFQFLYTHAISLYLVLIVKSYVGTLFNNVLIDRITVYIHFLVFITSLFNSNLYLHQVEMELRFVTRAKQNFFVGGGIVSQEIDFGSCEYRCTRMLPGKRIALYYVYLPTSVSLCKHLHRYNLFFISSTNSGNAPFRSSFFFHNEYRGIFLQIFRLFRYVLANISEIEEQTRI